MALRRIVYRPPAVSSDGPGAALTAAFEAIRAKLEVPEEFPADVLAEADVALREPRLPTRDETSVPFVTIDPPGAMDLDQAMFLERRGDGYRVRYAIADVPAFVAVGGALDQEARRRGQTIYCPDRRVPLHPPVLSEDGASLLPDQVRPAFVWDMVLAEDGTGTDVDVYRALVKSHQRLDYAAVQRALDDGTAGEPLRLLKEIGEKRIALERERGGASLPLPEQEVTEDEDGGFSVSFRPLAPVEDWNAQISLMTGMAAAEMMIHGQVGLLRTMPPPEHHDVQRFHRMATALGVAWPAEMLYGEFLRTLDRANPKHLALIHEAATLFRGAGYMPFEGDVPEQPEHAAVANPYAHVTAPLRRLVDRFGLVICEALSTGTDVPVWVRQALPHLPQIMAASESRASAVERACTDAVEAAELVGLRGSTLDAVVVDDNDKTVAVQLLDFAVVTRASGTAEPGDSVKVRVDDADIETGTIALSLVQ
ncbi:MAG TPA: RNB domain-containing ribonuclease [Intrasporangium sp.]|uniref:RNB domain-containing ribonuclease n=1 Tax=Intrasporangium sp. TaxID=1925024 RepID=UPI002D77ED2E|nr:RNB domain-containing ribonuclease [Intrasporangium sp.]HET7398685.1 RNB domain-containing ribonuclease [Intrasporangium sp.]